MIFNFLLSLNFIHQKTQNQIDWIENTCFLKWRYFFFAWTGQKSTWSFIESALFHITWHAFALHFVGKKCYRFIYKNRYVIKLSTHINRPPAFFTRQSIKSKHFDTFLIFYLLFLFFFCFTFTLVGNTTYMVVHQSQ